MFLVCLILAVGYTMGEDEFECYKCNSEIDYWCSDKDLLFELHGQNQDVSKVCRSFENDKLKQCFYSTTREKGVDVVRRGCANDENDVYVTDNCVDVDTTDEIGVMCTCGTSLCNSAQQNGFRTTIGIISALIVMKFF